MTTTDVKYTVVQHSAYAGKGDPRFIAGLESRLLRTKKEQDRVTKVGGVLFDDYMEAEEFAMTAQYPPGVEGLIPQAQGTFSDVKIDGLPIYIPVRSVVG